MVLSQGLDKVPVAAGDARGNFPNYLLTVAGFILQFPSSGKSQEPLPQLQERKWKHPQPHAVVLESFCNRGYWWYCRKRWEQGWGAVNLSHYLLIIFMVQNESCNSFKGKQDTPGGSHVVDKAARKQFQCKETPCACFCKSEASLYGSEKCGWVLIKCCDDDNSYVF